MSETESSEDTPRENKETRKSSKVGTFIAAALIAGVAATGGLFGGKLLHAAEPQHKTKVKAEPEAESASENGDGDGDDEESEEGSSKSAMPTASVALPQVIVDIRDKDGDVHHMKVGISLELGQVSEEEFSKILPRGREAAVMFLRSLNFEVATDPKQFDTVRKDLGNKVRAALGKKHVRRVVITDYVAQ
jgi:flagellar basal body-associated protein FliL